VSGSYTNSEMRTSVPPVDATGIIEGRRLPTVPKFQMAAAATYQWQLTGSAQAYVTGTFQHIGERFTQVNDLDLGTLDLLSFGANTIGGPLTQSTFSYDPKLPAYSLINLRLGLRHGQWDIAAYVNNLTNELAYLALDRERGTLARVGYLTNMPRTAGITTRFTF